MLRKISSNMQRYPLESLVATKLCMYRMRCQEDWVGNNYQEKNSYQEAIREQFLELTKRWEMLEF